jgi:tRNA(fMet)-specific endonuclease VapC
MKGYLLDTNAVHKWSTQDATIVAHVRAVGNARIETSVITFGETECGHRRNPPSDPARRAACTAWILRQFIKPLDVTRFTSEHYGEIKAELFKLYPPKTKTRFVDGCYDHVSGAEIGIDENDLWLAAQAIEHNLILVSGDKMNRIRDAAGNVLVVENWEVP